MTARKLFGSRILWVAILLLIGGYFRVLAVDGTVVVSPIRADAKDYYLSAYNLVHHGTYSRSSAALEDPPGVPEPDAYRAPGVGLMIAPFMSLWPDHGAIVRRVQIVNILLGLAAVAAIFFAASLVLPRPAAVAVGFLAATSPHLLSLTVYLLSETPAVFLGALFLAVCALGVPVERRLKAIWFLGLGMIIGCLSLFRPAFIAFAPVLALAFPQRSDKLQGLLYGCLGAALVVAPWTIRNALNVPPGGPSLLATAVLAASYRDFAYNGDMSTFPYGFFLDPRFDALATSLAGTVREVLGKIAADPVGLMIWYFVQKAVYLFQWVNIDGAGDILVYPVTATPFRTNALFMNVHAVHRAGHVLLLSLAAVGAAGAWWSRMTQSVSPAKLHVLRMASLLVAYVYLVHVPFVVNTRYALPVFPAIYLLAVFVAVVALRALLKPMFAKGRPAEPLPAVAGVPQKHAGSRRKGKRARR